MIDERLESRVLRFEEAWHREGPTGIADILDEPPALSTADRARLLFELIAIDLEFRWRNTRRDADAPERHMLEAYVASFPKLGPLDGLPLELVGEEYRVRCRWGDRPLHEGFLSRFAAEWDEVRARLIAIDRELLEEDDRPIPGPGERAFPLEEPAAPEPDIPLLISSFLPAQAAARGGEDRAG
jgi:hypothetical protein